ncbi:MAG: ABC transporter permease [Caldisericota bacterium]|jgi:peptide/nickel transport system permease protein|nr:ABC transporter permease [Caldisericota bacterium]
MRDYIIRRILGMIPLILIVMIVSFGIFSLVPNPFAALTENPRIKRADVERLKHAWGFDLPWHLRFFRWFGGVVRGDWGPSLLFPGSTAREVIGRALPITMRVMGLEFLLALIIALPIGILSAVKQYSITDYIVTVISFFGMSMPTFWFGLLMMMFFSVLLKRPSGMPLLPAGGLMTPGLEDAPFFVKFGDRLQYLVMPVAVLAFNSIGGWTRYMRTSMLEVIRQDYIRTARAKGVPERFVINRHALRNALIPIVTLVALSAPIVVGGAAITETIFTIPGMGSLIIQAQIKADYPTAMIALMLSSILVIVFNLVADIVYAWIDPRIKYS